MPHKLKHIAIAVKDIEASKRLFTMLTNSDASDTIDVPDQKVQVCFIHNGETQIELIQPTEGNVGVAKFLEKKGEGLHHLCLEVDNINAALAHYKSKGFRLIDEAPRIGAEGHLIAFLHPQSTNGVLIELEESGEKVPDDQISH